MNSSNSTNSTTEQSFAPIGSHPLIDIGVNFTNKSFHQDLDQVIANAQNHGVEQCIITGTSEQACVQALALCDRYPQLYCTAGVHPHEAKAMTPNTLQTLTELCQHERVKAVGETGLDFNRNFSPPLAQEKAFEQQIELAYRVSLPLFVHERDAQQRLVDILQHHRDHLVDCVIHCFTGSREMLFRYLDLDCHIGITGWICDERRGKTLNEIVANIPLDRLMVETDAPYLLPRDIKPKPKPSRNEPKFLPHIVRRIAHCYGKDPETIAIATTATATQFFQLPPTTNQRIPKSESA